MRTSRKSTVIASVLGVSAAMLALPALFLLAVSETVESLLVLSLMALMNGAILVAIRECIARAWASSDTPTSRIRSAPQGYVELAARGVPIDTGPVSGRPASRLELWAERRERRGRTSVTVDRLYACRPKFFLAIDDGTDRCVVALAEAEVDGLVYSEEQPSAIRRAELARFFSEGAKERLAIEGDWKITERIIAADQDLYVIGRFHSLNSIEELRDTDWTQAVARRGARMPGWAHALARFAAERSEQMRLAMYKEWRELMRSIEGTEAGAPLKGTVRLSVLTRDYETRSSRPLIVSHRPEREVMRGHYRMAALFALVLVVFAGLTVIVAEERFPETVHRVLGPFGSHLKSLIPRGNSNAAVSE